MINKKPADVIYFFYFFLFFFCKNSKFVSFKRKKKFFLFTYKEKKKTKYAKYCFGGTQIPVSERFISLEKRFFSLKL